jgi:RNA polymerase sigma-70 factor, ECF subfamily
VPDESAAKADNITELLRRSETGDAQAKAELYQFLQRDLRAIASSLMGRERAGHTLQATALVNELFLRFSTKQSREWQNRGHFLAVASQVMRRILIDYARSHRTDRRGGAQRKLSLDDVLEVREGSAASLLELDQALDRLQAFSARQAQIVEMHFFGSLTFEEIAAELNVSTRTVERDWRLARAWLYRQMNPT